MSRLEDLTKQIAILEFLQHAQREGISLCHIFKGDDPQPISSDEETAVVDSYIQQRGNGA